MKGVVGVGTAHEVDPGADAHLFALLHHLEGLIEEDLTSEGVVNNFDVAVSQGESPPRGVLLHGNAASEGQLEDDAASEGVGDVIVPEGKVALRLRWWWSAPDSCRETGHVSLVVRVPACP